MNTGRRIATAALALSPMMLASTSEAATNFAPRQSAGAWVKFLESRKLRTASLRPHELVLAALDFFVSTRATGLDSEPGSDMLLYQWGVFDFGRGEFFEFDLTRQFISDGHSGDEAFSQLRCTAYFSPTPELRAIPSANRWCKSRADAGEFKKFILGSRAYAAVENRVAAKVVAEWGRV
ncbi:hypothetical protein [Roseateles sp. BYS96W]|uniref:Uncharacterized protein n=1 Tax=Pelomonas nitida TaxID=3299027 RepID=A0ABW7GB43_9BURK